MRDLAIWTWLYRSIYKSLKLFKPRALPLRDIQKADIVYQYTPRDHCLVIDFRTNSTPAYKYHAASALTIPSSSISEDLAPVRTPWFTVILPSVYTCLLIPGALGKDMYTLGLPLAFRHWQQLRNRRVAGSYTWCGYRVFFSLSDICCKLCDRRF